LVAHAALSAQDILPRVGNRQTLRDDVAGSIGDHGGGDRRVTEAGCSFSSEMVGKGRPATCRPPGVSYQTTRRRVWSMVHALTRLSRAPLASAAAAIPRKMAVAPAARPERLTRLCRNSLIESGGCSCQSSRRSTIVPWRFWGAARIWFRVCLQTSWNQRERRG